MRNTPEKSTRTKRRSETIIAPLPLSRSQLRIARGGYRYGDTTRADGEKNRPGRLAGRNNKNDPINAIKTRTKPSRTVRRDNASHRLTMSTRPYVFLRRGFISPSLIRIRKRSTCCSGEIRPIWNKKRNVVHNTKKKGGSRTIVSDFGLARRVLLTADAAQSCITVGVSIDL